MSEEKTMDRRSFLTSAVSAWAAVTLGACASDSASGGTGGAAMGGTGGTGIAGTGGEGTGGTSAITGGTAASTGGASSVTGGASANTGGASAGTGATTASTGGNDMSVDASVDAGGTGGSQNSGGTYVCTTNTDNGDHSHPLTVPGSDVERGYQDAPYTLEDGGTGHTHTLTLSAYDFLYLQSGTMVSAESSTDLGHSHPCVIGCTMS